MLDMPEGPETRRVALRLSRALVGKPLVEVLFDVPGIAECPAELQGANVTDITSRGKALLTTFSTGHVMYSHNLLYGRWTVNRGQPKASRRRRRVLLRTAALSVSLYSATEIQLVPQTEVEQISYLRRLGPDVLDLGAVALRARLRDKQFKGRQLGALLLDQTFVAGIGNYLRAEALFIARISPAKRPRDLDAREVRALADAIDVMGERAVRTGGVTLDERRLAKAKSDHATRRDARHFVYGRGGRPCHLCDTAIARADIGGRHLYACPTCQGWPVRASVSGALDAQLEGAPE